MTLHGCHNRPPLRNTLNVQTGWDSTGARIMRRIPNRMSRDCRHELRAVDPQCAGCRWVDPKKEDK